MRRTTCLDGARVLLTGASSGIGRALALRLAAAGAQLVVAARRLELLHDLCDEISATGSPRPQPVETDLGVPGAATALADTAMRLCDNRIDIVINNSGASLTGATVRIGDHVTARAVYEVNLWTPLALCAALAPVMVRQGAGTIVNVTSTMQSVPLPLLGYYTSSKVALAQATRTMRLELSDTPIRVVEVVPGATDTALRDVDTLPWKTTPPRTLPPVTPESSARAIVKGITRGGERIVYPAYSLAPLEVPVIGRTIARIGARRVDTRTAL